jgi:ParB family chromosome partitioning protein
VKEAEPQSAYAVIDGQVRHFAAKLGFAIEALQKEAVARLVKHHEASAAWVEVTEGYRSPDWQYREAKEGEQGGVLINLSPAGQVDIREGLAKRDIDRRTAEETADNPIARRKPKAAYSAVLCAYIAHHKTAAVQELLLACPRKAKEVPVVDRLMQYLPHEALPALVKEAEPQSAYAVIDDADGLNPSA